MELNRDLILLYARGMLGRPYLLGAKWRPEENNPQGPIDCSGITLWSYGRDGVVLPDGSYNQFLQCVPCSNPLPADLGFFRNAEGNIHHVGMINDEDTVIEARGAPYNAVILRPRKNWEAWPEFTGWMRLKGVS